MRRIKVWVLLSAAILFLGTVMTAQPAAFPEAFRVIGNIYWVGGEYGSYLITTPQGHILLDTGSTEMHDVTLNCRYIWRAPFKVPDKQRKYGNLTLTYASQLHIAVVEIEPDTFVPRILDYVAVDDCGTVINPPIVEGQVYGATAHGIGAALMETCAYDAVGNMLTSTFSDYTPITSLNIPNIKYGHISTPSPHSYSGAKGMGEGGAAPIHTISSALQDALFAQGIFINDSFNNADSIFRALKQQNGGQLAKLVKMEKR